MKETGLIFLACTLLFCGAAAYPLPGWNGTQVSVMIAHSDIPQDLTNFPVLVHLSGTSGKNQADMRDIFSVLGSNAKKIAFTTANGKTQCPVEIESWDAGSREAWLWVKIPLISSAADTQLYLYYDPAHADNTAYVGDTGSAVAATVWDSNYAGVWHMTPAGSSVPDSTASHVTGVVSGGTTVNGKAGKAIRLPGDWSNVTVPYSANQNPDNTVTVETWVSYNGGRSPVSAPGLETTDGWTFFSPGLSYSGRQYAAWQTEGVYSYEVNFSPVALAADYGELSQQVNLSRFSRIWFDAELNGSSLAGGTPSASVRLDNTSAWTKSATTAGVIYRDQALDFSASGQGMHTLRFRLQNPVLTSPAPRATYRLDNIRTDMGSIMERPGAYGLFFRGLDGDTDLVWSLNSRTLTAPTIQHGAWHSLAGVFGNKKMLIYADGSQAVQADYETSINRPAAGHVMGKYLDGTLDEIRLSKTARTAAWIAVSKLSADDGLLSYNPQVQDVQISVNGALTNWSLAIGDTTDSSNLSVTVTCGAPYSVTVSDALDGGKPAGTAGFMAEAAGTSYVASGKVLSSPLRIRAGNGTFIDLSGNAQLLMNGTGAPAPGTVWPVAVQQHVMYSDARLQPPNLYRIVVTFAGAKL